VCRNDKSVRRVRRYRGIATVCKDYDNFRAVQRKQIALIKEWAEFERLQNDAGRVVSRYHWETPLLSRNSVADQKARNEILQKFDCAKEEMPVLEKEKIEFENVTRKRYTHLQSSERPTLISKWTRKHEDIRGHWKGGESWQLSSEINWSRQPERRRLPRSQRNQNGIRHRALKRRGKTAFERPRTSYSSKRYVRRPRNPANHTRKPYVESNSVRGATPSNAVLSSEIEKNDAKERMKALSIQWNRLAPPQSVKAFKQRYAHTHTPHAYIHRSCVTGAQSNGDLASGGANDESHAAR